jgi:hypothetical protein
MPSAKLARSQASWLAARMQTGTAMTLFDRLWEPLAVVIAAAILLIRSL